MSNKFLPFVTQKSSPIYIYDALLSRSKGVHKSITTTLFYIILKEGILAIRKYADSLPPISGTALYDEIINHFLPSRIDNTLLDTFTDMGSNMESRRADWDSELNKFDIPDVMCFMLVMALLDKLEEVTELNFSRLLEFDTILGDLPDNIKLSNDGVPVSFDSTSKLRNFILYMSVFEKDQERAYNVSLVL